MCVPAPVTCILAAAAPSREDWGHQQPISKEFLMPVRYSETSSGDDYVSEEVTSWPGEPKRYSQGSGSRIGAAALISVGAIAGISIVMSIFALIGNGQDHTMSPRDIVSYYPADKYEAVELVSGETFFGKVSIQNNLLQLSYVYYYSQPSGQLVQRGNEPFGPNGPMVINTAQILKIEPVGPNSQVAKQIAALQSGNSVGSPMTTTTTGGLGFQ